ncbi:MAG TPA: hypothetical protein VIF15_06525 [Polyangiaceae bacterium]
MRSPRRAGLVATALLVGLAGAATTRGAAAQDTPTWGGADVAASTFSWRRMGDASPGWGRGYGAAWGPTLAVQQGGLPLRFTGLVQFDVKAFDGSSWAVGLTSTAFEAALRLGPFEPQARAGFTLATLDDFAGQWSAELFSPRVEAGLAVHVRRVRVSLGAQAELLWRWFGPSVLERGFVLDVRIERPWYPSQ